MGVNLIGVIEVKRGNEWHVAVTVDGMPYDRPHNLLHYLPDPPRGLPPQTDVLLEEKLESLSYWTMEEIQDAFEGDVDGPAEWPDSPLLRKVFALMDAVRYACHVKERHVRWVWGLS